MKVMLINPPKYEGLSVSREDRCETTIPNILPPMGLVYLASILENGHDVQLIDANGFKHDWNYIRARISDQRPGIVIFRATPETFFSDIKAAKIAKEIDASTITVMICWSLTSLPSRVLEKAPHVD